MRKIVTGIIGCGKGAHLHAQALLSLPQVQFKGYTAGINDGQGVCSAVRGLRPIRRLRKWPQWGGSKRFVICTPPPPMRKWR